MKCLSCQQPMTADVGDFDYTKLTGLRGVTVTLCDVTIHQCASCGPTLMFVEIRRIADLERELTAAKVLHVKQLWCTFRDNEWAIAFTPIHVVEESAKTTAPRRRRKRAS